MTEKELEKLLAPGETETVEFKESPGEAFYKTVCAFANTKGGRIVLGVDKEGNIVGVEPGDQFLESLTSRIVNKLSIYPEIDTIDIKGKRVISVKVIHPGYPVSYEGRYYERVGNTTREMEPGKLRALLLKGKPWDVLTTDISINEIDADTVKHFTQLAVDSNRLTDTSLNDAPEVVLKKLGFIIDGKISNGAVLLFGKDPQKYFINLCTRIGRFKTETTVIDDKWAKGNLFRQYEETVNIIKQHISVRYEIEGFERKDVWEYPLEAIREALLNALIHRDCFNIANFITIKIYDDHIWFSNPGGLPEGITINDLKKPHDSFLRNPLLAKAFYLSGNIEQYGRGTVRMVEWMKEQGLPEPEYKEELGGFSVYFYKDIYTEENLKKIGLNERQIKAVVYVKEKGKITNKEYRDQTGISDEGARIDLKDLVKKRVLLSKGRGRNAHYILR